ncbi:hypothetical protein M407DRAFT_99495 [Tulasnella calospora MUT 4182]|uniref:Rhamnolipids biosynthesis 3-oxoacyl-[acyl-carrier-protein] reductase n=1 Tax=Tulasnella calospora MUT 4182 TaxID=1051891 RepID=A0A0C3QGH8_9AGAM|nr:hypothetical protein M407DRAFT_99495 [Tulasnella calospora MUT 4182]
MPAPDLSVGSLFSVANKIALVTGGGSGIGTMIAAALVRNGAKVYIASRKEKQLKEVSDKLNAMGPGSCHYIVADLGSKAGCDALAEEIKKRESKIHILVNNSGATWGATWENVPEKEGWDRVMALNVKGIFYLTVGLTDLLAKDSTAEDPARVINISSISSWETTADDTALAAPGSGLWSYYSSKAAVNHLTQLMATTLSKRKITVNAILPGIFPTKMSAYSMKQSGDAISNSQPMGRLGDVFDMAGVALFLTSKASRHVNGALIPVDGGAYIHGNAFGGGEKARL